MKYLKTKRFGERTTIGKASLNIRSIIGKR
jgi:hypothetical protein